jgi:hypothetical protein
MFCFKEKCFLQEVLLLRSDLCHWRPTIASTEVILISVWRGPFNTKPNGYITVLNCATNPFHRYFSFLNGLLSPRHHRLTIAANKFWRNIEKLNTGFVSELIYSGNYAGLSHHIWGSIEEWLTGKMRNIWTLSLGCCSAVQDQLLCARQTTVHIWMRS